MMMKIIILVLGKDKGLHRETAREREREREGAWGPGIVVISGTPLWGWVGLPFFSLSHNSFS